MANLTPNPRATGQKVLKTYAEQRDRSLRSQTPGKLFPGPWRGVQMMRGAAKQSRSGSAFPAHGPVNPRDGPGSSSRGGSVARRLSPRSGPSRASASRGLRAGAPADAASSPGSGVWGGGLPAARHPPKSTSLQRSAYPGSCLERGARGCPGRRARLRVLSRCRAQPPHPSARERLPAAARPPTAPRSPIGPGIQAPPPDSPASPHPGSSPLRAGEVASSLSFPWLGQPGEGVILHPESV